MEEIKPLTSLRGFAAMAVVLQHFSATAQPLTPSWIPSIVPHGYMAVHFFFILSGFIMSLTYLGSFEARGLRAFPDFLLKRVARIVPLNCFALLVIVLLGVGCRFTIGTPVFFREATLMFDLPANLLMLQGLGIGDNLNGPSWSVSTEFAAYFLFPVFVVAVFNRRRWVTIATLIAALVLLCAIAAQSPRLGLGGIDAETTLLETFAEFVLGMGTFIMYRYRIAAGRHASDFEFAALTVAAGVFLIAGIDLPVSLLCPFIVAAAALNRGFWARFLSGGVPYFLGVISFSIYLIHDPFRPTAVALFHLAYPGSTTAAGALIFALLGSFAVIPFAWLTYIGIERPGRRVVRRWAEALSRKSKAPISASIIS